MFRDYRVTVDYRLLRGRTSGMGGGMTYTTWYHLMYWYDMIWYDMIPDNVIWCQWIICCTIWCSLVFIYLLVFDIHIDYLTWPYYHLINEYRLKKCTADFVTGSWSISPFLDLRTLFIELLCYHSQGDDSNAIAFVFQVS